MHPEIISEGPGQCPKCGMALVSKKEEEKLNVIKPKHDTGLGLLTWKSYISLVVVIFLIIIASVILSRGSLDNFIISFMTGFFLVFGMFKLMDLKGFAEGYSTYDLIAQKWFGYGYIYPFVELAFGFLMLAGYQADWLLWIEFIIMTFSGLGVAIKLLKKEPFMCVCLGTFLKVPLTKVTLIEDFGMAILALVMILR